MSRPIRFHHGILLLIIALGAFLLLMPTKVQPVAWNPEPAPSLSSGPYADNQRLKGVVRVGAADIDGPEALLLENNALITGLHDGRVIRTSLDGQDTRMLTDTGGRPLGLARHPNGLLVIADAVKGLLSLDAQGRLVALTTSADGVPLGFTDDVVIDKPGHYAYFSDASAVSATARTLMQSSNMAATDACCDMTSRPARPQCCWTSLSSPMASPWVRTMPSFWSTKPARIALPATG